MNEVIGSLTDDEIRNVTQGLQSWSTPGLPWTHDDLTVASAGLATRRGGFVVASGGTTGDPKIITLSPDLGVPRVIDSWRPFGVGDVMLNLFPTGRLWGAHYFYNAVATNLKAIAVPMGALGPDDLSDWIDVIRDLKVTALAGAPNVVAGFADMLLREKIRLNIRSIVWSGEPLTPGHVKRIKQSFPKAGFWGNYGSIETFVIGVSHDTCRLGVLHLLPGQCLEIDDHGALLTRSGDGWPVPAWRFRLGDRIATASCTCGNKYGFEILGRADDAFKLYGGRVRIGDLLRNATSIQGVVGAQAILYRDPDVPAAIMGLVVRYTGQRHPLEVRQELVSSLQDLTICDRHTPEAIRIEKVGALDVHPRTLKVLPVIWREARHLDELTGVVGVNE